MSNYWPEQNFDTGKFHLQLHPYLAVPEDVIDPEALLQYGADFKLRFARAAPQTHPIGLMQLIFPQTSANENNLVGRWNVDKRDPTPDQTPMRNCMYGEPGETIAEHSQFYAGQPARHVSPAECWLIDTPRECSKRFDHGRLTSNTDTKFANYVVDTATGKVFDHGMVWGYHVVQNSKKLNEFEPVIVAPKESRLSQSNEHLDAIARFLKLTRDEVKSYIA
ncbi:hypothetical protein RDV84_16245 [Lysobacter yananisis]|uniref:Uncharacterized protein n=1 Tax=Lysobacter yananisis TaxID=1003114 RepID=A0ABY9P696_9GAMM|nr:hypothetical protein [Lysobacter yananisis]WMT01525.1 hypothetical protein RDV84_16245 [Lysobacter yananisis]